MTTTALYPQENVLCHHADNQALCDALWRKAQSYPVQLIYVADAYAIAAEKVAALTRSVFSMADNKQQHLGGSREADLFIHRWILKAKPESLVLLMKNNKRSMNLHTMMALILDRLQAHLSLMGYADLATTLESAIADIRADREDIPEGLTSCMRLDAMFKDMSLSMDGYEVSQKVLIDMTNFVKRNGGDPRHLVVILKYWTTKMQRKSAV